MPIPVIHCHPKSERGFMQIYTENRFCLPLFCLIVLGVALSVLSCPDKAFAEDASSGVHEGQPRQAPKGLPPSRMPEAFPGFSPDAPSKCPALAPQQAHDGSRFDSRLFAMPLPQNLTPEQQQAALAIMREAEPCLTVIHIQLRQTLTELHNLSFASDTPPDALAVIGRKLIRLRTEAIRELQRISAQMEKLAGFNPGWGTRVRGTKIEDLNPQPLNEQSVE